MFCGIVDLYFGEVRDEYLVITGICGDKFKCEISCILVITQMETAEKAMIRQFWEGKSGYGVDNL